MSRPWGIPSEKWCRGKPLFLQGNPQETEWFPPERRTSWIHRTMTCRSDQMSILTTFIICGSAVSATYEPCYTTNPTRLYILLSLQLRLTHTFYFFTDPSHVCFFFLRHWILSFHLSQSNVRHCSLHSLLCLSSALLYMVCWMLVRMNQVCTWLIMCWV